MAEIFLPFRLILSHGRSGPRQKYISGWVLGVARKTDSGFIPRSIFTGVKSPKFVLDFQPESHLKRSGIETEQHVGNLQQLLRVQMNRLNTHLARYTLPVFTAREHG